MSALSSSLYRCRAFLYMGVSGSYTGASIYRVFMRGIWHFVL